MNIEVTKDSVIILENSDTPHENEYKITECRFNFDDFTNSFQVKRAIFTILSTDEMYETDIINNKCDIPAEVLKHEYEIVKLGVYGFNIDENDDLANRFSPSYAEFTVPTGSYRDGAVSPEIITPTQYDLYSQALQEGLEEVNSKLDDIDEALTNVNEAIVEVNDAIEETNNLNLNVSDKVDGDVTVTLTKKDATTKSVVISDGTSLQFMWQGTSLGIKTDDMSEYVFVDLQGIQGVPGPQGEPFRIKKTYPSIADMNADFDNMEYGDYVMIASTVEVEDNAKLYTRGENQWIFMTDFSGATGIKGETGATPNIQIGTVTSGSTPNVTRTGTDENPILNFVLQPGQTGPQGQPGTTGATGNGIASIEKTSTSGLVDTYTITFTNGQTTTYQITNGANGNVVDVQVDGTSVVDNGIANIIGLTQMKQELEDMYNLLPKVSGTGETITLDGTVAGKMLVDLKGNTSQETTTGSQLIDFTTLSNSNTTNSFVNDILTVNTSSGTYANAFKDITSIYKSNSSKVLRFDFTSLNSSTDLTGQNGYVRLRIVKTDNSVTNVNLVNTDKSISTHTIPNDVSDISSTSLTIYANNTNTAMTNTVTINKPILHFGSTSTDYEPYTNGVSPNPDFPSDIHVVSGDNSIDVCGKNLSQLENGSLWDSNGAERDLTNSVRTKFIIFESGMTITPKIFTSLTTRYLQYCLYDSSKTFISLNNFTDGTPITTSNTNVKYIRFKMTGPVNGSMTIDDINFMVVSGTTTPTTYEAYTGASYPISLGDIELCKIGDYQDSIKKSTGKNLCNTTFELGGIDTTTGQNGSGTDRVRTKDYVEVKPNTTYTLSGVQGSRIVCFYNSSKAYLSYEVVGSQSTSGTFITPNDTSYIRWYIIQTNTNINEMLNEGSTALPYEPYGKIWYLNKQIGKVILNGSENWLYSLQANVSRFDTTITNAVKGSATNNPILSTHFKTEFALTNRRVFLSGSGNLISIIDNDFSNTNDFKNWLSSNNVTCYYGYTTPTYTEITDSTLLSQLEALYNAKSKNSQTNITQENNDLPFILDTTALKQLTQ